VTLGNSRHKNESESGVGNSIFTIIYIIKTRKVCYRKDDHVMNRNQDVTPCSRMHCNSECLQWTKVAYVAFSTAIWGRRARPPLWASRLRGPRAYAGASPQGGLGWTCPPHFCQRSFLGLIQIQWIFTREEGCWGWRFGSLQN